MKKQLISLLVIMMTAICADAQTYLVNTHKPVDSFCYEAFTYNGPSSKKISMSGGLEWYGGFTVSHALSTYKPGYAVFELGGKYETLLFVMGHLTTNTGAGGTGIDTDPGIVAVYADGVKILERKVYPYGVPERMSLNVKSVDKLEFRLVEGWTPIGFAEATLWKSGETPRETGNLITSEPKVLELGKDIKPYFSNYIIKVIGDRSEPIRINGQTYDSGLSASMPMAISGNSWGSAYFNIRGRYSKLSFIAGPQDGDKKGAGWFTVKADDKIIWEWEVKNDDVARRVTLDVDGCEMLSFHSEQAEGNLDGGFVNIKVYPAGVSVPAEGMVEAPVDPRLKSLPDVCKLISNIPPYSIGSNVDKQIYDGRSDYVTFSMGGTRFNEGFILYSRSSVMSDSPVSYTVFDLGNEFDYLSFTAGYIGKSEAMTNNWLRIYADDELVFETELIATAPNRDFVVPVKKCRKLRFQNQGSGNLNVGSFGVADLVVYRGKPVRHNLFPHPKPECPYNVDLLDLGMPYIHYMGLSTRDEILLDGSTQKKYWMVGDRRVNKGFTLQAGTHFSFDFGPLSGGSGNASAGVAGAVAAGSAFVPVGAAVGGTLVGSTLVGAAALLALAAGGEAVENSCAAFNTYGEYNSLTFTVVCNEIFSAPDDYTETLWIGADGNVVAQMAVYESMEPQTVTVPIDGCGQLMFWLCNTVGTSGRYLFYDLKLTKERLPLNIPKAVRLSNVVLSRPVWDVPEKMSVKWERPENTGNRDIDYFIQRLAFLYNDVNKMMEKGKPGYEINTYFLESNDGQKCKAVRFKSLLSGRAEQNIVLEKDYADSQFAKLLKLRDEHGALGVALSEFRRTDYADVLNAAESVLKESGEIIGMMISSKGAELAFMEKLLDAAVDIDGKVSTEKTIFCPVFPDDRVPEDGLMLVEVFSY